MSDISIRHHFKAYAYSGQIKHFFLKKALDKIKVPQFANKNLSLPSVPNTMNN